MRMTRRRLPTGLLSSHRLASCLVCCVTQSVQGGAQRLRRLRRPLFDEGSVRLNRLASNSREPSLVKTIEAGHTSLYLDPLRLGLACGPGEPVPAVQPGRMVVSGTTAVQGENMQVVTVSARDLAHLKRMGGGGVVHCRESQLYLVIIDTPPRPGRNRQG
jgi:hypothetical protein